MVYSLGYTILWGRVRVETEVVTEVSLYASVIIRVIIR